MKQVAPREASGSRSATALAPGAPISESLLAAAAFASHEICTPSLICPPAHLKGMLRNCLSSPHLSHSIILLPASSAELLVTCHPQATQRHPCQAVPRAAASRTRICALPRAPSHSPAAKVGLADPGLEFGIGRRQPAVSLAVSQDLIPMDQQDCVGGGRRGVAQLRQAGDKAASPPSTRWWARASSPCTSRTARDEGRMAGRHQRGRAERALFGSLCQPRVAQNRQGCA